MKLRPGSLFLLTAVFSLAAGFLTRKETFDINLHDTYFIIGYLHAAMLFSLFAGCTALIYFGLAQMKRPVKSKTGYWHFGVFAAGLLVLMIFVCLGNSASQIYALPILLLISILLLFTSLAIFIFGLIRAIL